MLVDERVDRSWSRLVMLRRGRGLQVLVEHWGCMHGGKDGGRSWGFCYVASEAMGLGGVGGEVGRELRRRSQA